MSRRVAAVCVPQLLVELVTEQPGLAVPLPPMGVVLLPDDGGTDIAPHLELSQVSSAARHAGVRSGMTVAAARGVLSALVVRPLKRARARERLQHLAELCLPLSPGVEVLEPDVVLLEGTGTAHLFGGEAAWAEGIRETLARAGHRGRVAVAPGPGVATALARHGASHPVLVARGQERRLLWPLPPAALGFTPGSCQWLAQAGLATVADLAQQPREALARRLGADARRLRLLDVAHDPSADDRPLTPLQLPPRLAQAMDLVEHPAEDVEVLLFWCKRAVDALAARMMARQLAAMELHLVLHHERGTPATQLHLPLALPLWHAADLLGGLRPLLERTVLPGAVRVLEVFVPRTAPRPPLQDSHLQEATVHGPAPRVRAPGQKHLSSPRDAVARLWAELVAEVGLSSVGVLGLQPTQSPEAATALLEPDTPVHLLPVIGRVPRPAPLQALVAPELHSSWYPVLPGMETTPTGPAEPPAAARPTVAPAHVGDRVRAAAGPAGSPLRQGGSPLRVFQAGLELPAPPTPGQPLGPGLPPVVEVQAARRLWTEWWRPAPLKRDYVEVMLEGGLRGWVYVEPDTGRALLQGWMD